MILLLIFILIGMIAGGSTAGASGVFLGGFTGYLLWHTQQLREQLDDLRNKLMQLSKKLVHQTHNSESSHSSSIQPIPQTPEVPPKSTSALNTIDKSDNSTVRSMPDAVTAVDIRPTRAQSQVWQSEQWSTRPSPVDDPVVIRWIKDYFTTGNTLVRVGVIILFFGVAFLVKYAAEKGIVPIELRLISVALGGLAMLVIGWRVRGKNAGFALAAQGGGIGVIYLTIFAAMRLYDLLPPSLAFFMLLAMCAMSSLLAVLQDSRALAILGFSGGFLAPVLTSTGEGSHVVLFSYYALLNAGILGIAWYKSWRPLNLVGFVFTFVIGTAWGVMRYRPDLYASTEPFLLLFFLFYVAISVLYALRQPINLRGYIDGSLVFGTPIIVFSLQFLLVRNMEYGLAYSAMAACVFYVLLAYAIFKFVAKYNTEDGIKLICESFLSIGVVFGTVAIPLALDDQWTAAAWALEGCALIYIAIRQRRTLAYFAGFVLQAGAAWFVLQQLAHTRHANHWHILNGAYLSALLVCVAGTLSAYLIYRHKDNIKHYTHNTDIAMLVWAVLWWLIGGGYEIDGHSYMPETLGWVQLFGVVTAILAHVLGEKLKWQYMRWLDRSLLMVMLIAFVISVFELKHPFVEWLALSWLVTYMVYIALLKRNDTQSLSAFQKIQHSVGIWLLLVVLCWEGYWWITQSLPVNSVWGITLWLLLPNLTLVGLIYAVDRITWPFKQHKDLYLGSVSLPIVVYGLLAMLICAINSDGNAAPLDYLPIINPLDMALVFGFICILFWWQITKRLNLLVVIQEQRTEFKLALAAVMFVIVTSALLRTVHHWANVPYSLEDMIKSDVVQTSLTLLWSLMAVAIMIFSSKRQWRTIWLIGAGLITVVVVKLFIFDLSNVGTVERIISFIGVGILMLAVGYFAPLPTKQISVQDAQNKEPEIAT
jgi:uncharacterized membrane protein